MSSNTLQHDTLADLSALPREAFVARLGDIFEHSPWVAERAWDERPSPASMNCMRRWSGPSIAPAKPSNSR